MLSVLAALVGGFVIEMPVGPMATFVIRETLARGRAYGVAVGFAVAGADAVYGGLGIVGSQLPLHVLDRYHLIVHLVAGIVLAIVGVRFLTARPAVAAALPPAQGFGIVRTFATAVPLAVANPAAAVMFAAGFAAVGLHDGAKIPYALVAGGIFCGAMSWWLLLTAIVARMGAKGRTLLLVDRIVGAILLLAGVVSFASMR